jgi:hypothetical protein
LESKTEFNGVGGLRAYIRIGPVSLGRHFSRAVTAAPASPELGPFLCVTGCRVVGQLIVAAFRGWNVDYPHCIFLGWLRSPTHVCLKSR